MLCHYWYLSDKNFTFGPFLCDVSYNILQKSFMLKKSAYRISFLDMSKHETKKLMVISNLIDKKGVL